MPGMAKDSISFDIEMGLLDKGFSIIAGVDEAGRGSLAGPLSLGLVVYSVALIRNPPDEIISSIRDSKKLSPKKRTDALFLVEKNAVMHSFELVSHRIVDSLNVNGATEYALKKLLENISPLPDIILMDGNFSFDPGIPVLSVVKGDSKSFSIASASIVAKVNRDRIMKEYDSLYSGYSFGRNMGYGTLEHRKAIIRLGPSEIHRRTYEPVRGMLGREANSF